MKTLAALLLCLCSFAAVGQGAPARGVVVHRISGCDYFMVQTRNSFVVLEWFGGHDPNNDDKLVGDFGAGGLRTVKNEVTDQTTKVYVEDYGLSKADALEKLTEKCK